MLEPMGFRFIIAASCIVTLTSCGGEEQSVTPFGTLHDRLPFAGHA